LLLLTLIPKSLKITPENEPKRRKIAGIYLIALTFIAASNLNMSKAGELPKLIPGISISNPDKPVGELIKGVVVSQSFTAELDGLRKIDVLAATYARKNFGKLEIEVYEKI
jgi:hypothetical protein